MKPSFLLLALFLLLTACDCQESRGKHQSTATVELLQISSLDILADQIALINSEAVIAEAAALIQLSPNTISNSLEISHKEGSDVITITAHHDDETLNEKIVRAILASYTKRRNSLATETLAALNEKFLAQDNLFQATRKNLALFVEAYGIQDFDGPESLPRTEQEMFRSAKQRLYDLEIEADRLEIEVKRLATASDEDMFYSGLKLESTISRLHREYYEAKDKIKGLVEQGLGEEHPDILDLKTRAQETLERAVNASSSLVTSFNLVKRQIDRMGIMIRNRANDRFGIMLKKRRETYLKTKGIYLEARSLICDIESQRQDLRAKLGNNTPFFLIQSWEHQ